MTPRLLSIDAVAEQLGMSRRKVYELIASGQLAYVQIDGRKKIEPSAIDELIRSHRQRQTPPQVATPAVRVRAVTPIHEWPAAARFR